VGTKKPSATGKCSPPSASARNLVWTEDDEYEWMMKTTLVEEVQETWLTKAEALQKWGKDGLKDRLQKGTIQARRKSASVLSSLLFRPHVSCHIFVRPNKSSANGKSVVWVGGLRF